MTKETRSLDTRSLPKLARLAGQVRASNQPLFLVQDWETVAVLMPVGHPKPRGPRVRTEADHRAFMSSFGAWSGRVDVEQFKRDNAESRRISSRPLPVL